MAFSYKPTNITNGIFRNIYFDNEKFASFSFSTKESGDIKNIFTDDYSQYFRTNSEPNSSITMKLSQTRIKLTHISMYSCVSSNCANSIDVLGSNNGEHWSEVCKIRTNDDYFLGKVSIVECKSELFYRSIKLVQTGKTNGANHYFLIRYLEIFGHLIPRQNSRCLCIRHNSFPIYYMLIISK